MRKLTASSIAGTAFCVGYTEPIFYSGDSAPSSQSLSTNLSTGIWIYEEFSLAQTSRITNLFANQLGNGGGFFTPYEIRQGMQPGSSGVLIASGEEIASATPTGRLVGGQVERRHEIEIDPLILAPGTYTFTILTSFDTRWVTTEGLNSVGPTAGDAVSYGFNGTNQYTLMNRSFSMGVQGTVVPEPAAFTGFAVLLLGARRRTSDAK